MLGLPCASGHSKTADHIVEVQVVVSVAGGRFTIEGYLHRLADIAIKADTNSLTSCTIGYLIIYIFRLGIVPLTQYGPCGHVVGANQYDELVVGTGEGGGWYTATSIGSEG